MTIKLTNKELENYFYLLRNIIDTDIYHFAVPTRLSITTISSNTFVNPFEREILEFRRYHLHDIWLGFKEYIPEAFVWKLCTQIDLFPDERALNLS